MLTPYALLKLFTFHELQMWDQIYLICYELFLSIYFYRKKHNVIILFYNFH